MIFSKIIIRLFEKISVFPKEFLMFQIVLNSFIFSLLLSFFIECFCLFIGNQISSDDSNLRSSLLLDWRKFHNFRFIDLRIFLFHIHIVDPSKFLRRGFLLLLWLRITANCDTSSHNYRLTVRLHRFLVIRACSNHSSNISNKHSFDGWLFGQFRFLL